MKNYLKIFVPFTLAIILGSLTFAIAQTKQPTDGKIKTDGRGERPMSPPRGGGRGFGLHPRMLEQLNLTDAQKEQIEAIHTASRGASKENFDKIRTADEQLRTIIESGAFDEAQARTILTTKSEAMIETEIQRLRTDAAIIKILTAEQKTQLEQLKNERPEPPRGGGFRPAGFPQN